MSARIKVKAGTAFNHDFKSFAETLENEAFHFDKTLLLKEIIDEKFPKAVLITRPHHWGKSMNLSMIRYFFEKCSREDKSKKLLQFKNLKIGKVDNGKHLSYIGFYPVISFSFPTTTQEYSSFLTQLKDEMSALYEKYDSILETLKEQKEREESQYRTYPLKDYDILYFDRVVDKTVSENQLKYSLDMLVNLVNLYYKQQVIILIDNLDTVLFDPFLKNVPKIFNEPPTLESKDKEDLAKTQDFINEMVIRLIQTPSVKGSIKTMILTSITDPLVLDPNNTDGGFHERVSLGDSFLADHLEIGEEEVEEALRSIFEIIDEEVKIYVMNEIKEWFPCCYTPANKPLFSIVTITKYLEALTKAKKELPKPINSLITSSEILENIVITDKLKRFFHYMWHLWGGQKLGSRGDFSPETEHNIFSNFLKKSTVIHEQLLAYILLQSGFITKLKENNYTYYVIPSESVREFFTIKFIPRFLEYCFKIDYPIMSDFFDKIGNSIDDSTLFIDILKIFITDHIKKSDELNEPVLKRLLFSAVFRCFLENKRKVKYLSFLEKALEDGGIDNIFIPNPLIPVGDYFTTIIHKYKFERESVSLETSKNNLLWQILCKNYFSELIAKYKDSEIKDKWKLILRPIVFSKSAGNVNWEISVSEYLFAYEEADKINNFFKNNLSKEARKVLCDQSKKMVMEKERNMVLQSYKVDSLISLLKLIVQENIPIRQNNGTPGNGISELKRQEEGQLMNKELETQQKIKTS